MNPKNVLILFLLICNPRWGVAQGHNVRVPAENFFPRQEDSGRDARPVVYIELGPDEILVFTSSHNAEYILMGRSLDISAKAIQVDGPVVIRSFHSDSHGNSPGGTGEMGSAGDDGAPGSGDGESGRRGGRGGRGGEGLPGGEGCSAHRVRINAQAISFIGTNASLKIINSGEPGGDGQKGGTGGTGGPGGHGQDRTCWPDNKSPWSPGNGGPKGAAGVGGTGGRGGRGGNAGDVLLAESIYSLIGSQVSVDVAGGLPGNPGKPGNDGNRGGPGTAGAGANCGQGGNGPRDSEIEIMESYVPPISAEPGEAGKVIKLAAPKTGELTTEVKKKESGSNRKKSKKANSN